jgi:hypothetical protein
VHRVIGEMVRVTRDDAIVGVEAPVRAPASAADRVVFSGLEELRAAFGPHIRQELLAEEQHPHSATNEQGTEIARLVFRLRKDG